MVVLPARFVSCPNCGRLIAVDALNLTGHCTTDCGTTAEPRPAPDPERFVGIGVSQELLDKIAEGHVCPSVESGNPEDCGFGGVGCHG